MKLLTALGFIFSVLSWTTPVQARVFDLSRERFASYLTFSDGTSLIKDSTVTSESNATDYDDKIKTNMGGEFGFLYATRLITWRFGVEVLKPNTASPYATSGTNHLYSVQTAVNALIPKIGLEINLHTNMWSRIYAGAYAGQANVNITNDYSSLTIAPSSNFTMRYKGIVPELGAILGWEIGAFDTTSLVIEAGYRNMKMNRMTYAADVAADFQGTAHSSGDTVLDKSGNNRTMDFSGAYGSIGFRWWLF